MKTQMPLPASPKLRFRKVWVIPFAALVWAVIGSFAQQASPPAGTARENGETAAVTLPNGWRLSPAGRQVPLSTLPMSIALAPDEKHAVVLNGGFLPPTLSVIDTAAGRETARVPVKDAWHGLTFNASDDKLYVGGGSEAAVFEFNFQDGKLTAGRVFPVRPAAERRPSDHVGDVALSPDRRFLYVANLFRNRVTVMNASTGFVVKEFATGFRPYRLLMSPGGKTLFISHWAESSIGVYSLDDGRLLEKVPVGPHPTDMLIRPETDDGDDAVSEPAFEVSSDDPLLDDSAITARLFVACANTNSVWSLGLTKSNRVRPLGRIVVSPTPHAPAGSTPTALALGPEGRYLYVVTSDNNAVVVVDVSEGRSRIAGAIPTGWYPTDVAVTNDGTLLYLSGKGGGSYALPRGPDPTRRSAKADYVASRQTGSLGILPLPGAAELDRLTRRVIDNSLFDASLLGDAGVPEGNPIPNRAGLPSPIRHVIYVIKENRTYDQVLGDIESGRGDRGLAVFRRVRNAQPSQAQPRIRSLRQLPHQRRRERRRVVVVGLGDGDRLHPKAVAELLRPPAEGFRFRGRRPDGHSAGALFVVECPGSRADGPQLRSLDRLDEARTGCERSRLGGAHGAGLSAV